ncbi:MAG: hypothetical protein JXB05_07565 [Myxococcaceae bacterium]|nr:hypothetical protein [Myxococcaceae bacterium]
MSAAREALRRGLAAGVLLLSSAASACPMCMSTQESNRAAYIAGSLLLTLLPLGMLIGLAVYLRRRMREQEREDDAARTATARATPSP